jgi:hypothetical protein
MDEAQSAEAPKLLCRWAVRPERLQKLPIIAGTCEVEDRPSSPFIGGVQGAAQPFLKAA